MPSRFTSKPLISLVKRSKFFSFFLGIALAVLCLFIFLNFTQGSYNKPEPKTVTQAPIVDKASIGSPVRLIIPSININANIQHLGVTQTGEMEIPANIIDVGWFSLGPRPGERGSAVIAGHFNGENNEAGVFNNLHKLKMGDQLYIEDDNGKTTSFIVRETRTYKPGYADEVFNLSNGAHLNLITCDGVWDAVEKSYSKRLVVFADLSLP